MSLTHFLRTAPAPLTAAGLVGGVALLATGVWPARALGAVLIVGAILIPFARIGRAPELPAHAIRRLDDPIAELGLSRATFAALRRRGIETIRDLLAMDPARLLDDEDLTPAQLREVRDALVAHGVLPSLDPDQVDGQVSEQADKWLRGQARRESATPPT